MQKFTINSKYEDNLSSKVKLIRLYENDCTLNEKKIFSNNKTVNSPLNSKYFNNHGNASPKLNNVHKYKGKDPLIKNLPKGLRIYELNEKISK